MLRRIGPFMGGVSTALGALTMYSASQIEDPTAKAVGMALGTAETAGGGAYITGSLLLNSSSKLGSLAHKLLYYGGRAAGFFGATGGLFISSYYAHKSYEEKDTFGTIIHSIAAVGATCLLGALFAPAAIAGGIALTGLYLGGFSLGLSLGRDSVD